MTTTCVVASWRSTKRRLEIPTTTYRVVDLKRKIQEEFDIQCPVTLLYAGRKLLDDQQPVAGLDAEKKELHILVLATCPEKIQQIQQSKSDPLMRPLEGRTSHGGRVGPWRKRSQQPRLHWSCVALQGFPDRHKAQEILERLVTERGVVAVVQKYNLSVARLTEMYPHGKVGIDPVCVLGLNKGDEIQLRLRTDDLQGFRSYDKILQVLFHELAHCRYKEHDRAFYDFMNRLEKEAYEADWTKQGGRRIMEQAPSNNSDSMMEDRRVASSSRDGIVLGGKQQSNESPREAAIRAALLRHHKKQESQEEKK